MPLKGNTIAREVNELKEKHAREMTELKERLATLEMSQNRGVVTRDLSDQEEWEEESSQ